MKGDRGEGEGDRGKGGSLKDVAPTVEVTEVKNLKAADVKSVDKTSDSAVETAEEVTSEEPKTQKEENENGMLLEYFGLERYLVEKLEPVDHGVEGCGFESILA